jgi:putative acetyltransferase
MNFEKIFIRKILKSDNPGLEELIKTVMPEFGAIGPGFAINDPEVCDMFSTYQLKNHAYFVVTDGQLIFGGGGIAPLEGIDNTICELRKMYFKPILRGRGIGQLLMNHCLDEARLLGYKNCYLETLAGMDKAQKLYFKNGFEPIPHPLGNTGHFSCDRYFLKKL